NGFVNELAPSPRLEHFPLPTDQAASARAEGQPLVPFSTSWPAPPFRTERRARVSQVDPSYRAQQQPCQPARRERNSMRLLPEQEGRHSCVRLSLLPQRQRKT